MTTNRKKPANPTAQPRYATIPEIMAEWRCSYDFVWQLIRRGTIASMKVGNQHRVPRAEVARYEAAMTSKPAA